MPFVEGGLQRLQLLKENPQFKDKLWEIATALQEGLKARGFNLGNTTSCVTPVILDGSVPEATQLVTDLRDNHGIFCSIVVYPVIPRGMILLRLIPTAVHTLQDVEVTLEAFTSVAEKLRLGAYRADQIAAKIA